jgi:enamine deaminase RidA (YjgF/YER057c/UK114 family)
MKYCNGERAALERSNVMSYEKRIKEMGYTIEPLLPSQLDNGRFCEAVRIGNLIYTSGQVPMWGEKVVEGKVGQEITLEKAREAAVICTLNGLRAIKTIIGSLDNIVRIVKIFGMVNAAPSFDNTPGVIDASSTFLRDVFGTAGLHSRSAVGMILPLNFAVEIEMVVEVRD